MKKIQKNSKKKAIMPGKKRTSRLEAKKIASSPALSLAFVILGTAYLLSLTATGNQLVSSQLSNNQLSGHSLCSKHGKYIFSNEATSKAGAVKSPIRNNAAFSYVTGKASSGQISVKVTVIDSNEINFSARLADDNSSIFLYWGNYLADNYSIYATSNLTAGFPPAPLASGITSMNYTDTTAGGYSKRYYKLSYWRNGIEYFRPTILGKFTIALERSTLTPGEIEMNTVSFPLVPFNISVQAIANQAENGDVISTYNRTRSPPAYDSVMKFSTGWSGDFSEINVLRGYDFTIVGNPYNITLIGKVPEGMATVELMHSTLTPGEIEMNSIAWNSAYKNCEINKTLYNITSVGDVISTYDRYSSPPKYISIRRFASGWFGDFNCFEPGKGYSFTIVASAYNFSYNRSRSSWS